MAEATGIDAVALDLSRAAASGLGWILAFLMFSVGLSLKLDDFRRVATRPWVVAWGAAVQIVLLPAGTFLLTFVLTDTPSIALGMMVVAACPSGNSSNVLTQAARGDTALSVTLTALVSALAVLTTPFNILFWTGLHPDTRGLMAAVGLDRQAFLLETVTTLGIPLAIGVWMAERLPRFAARAQKPLHSLSLLILVGFIAGALAQNGGPLAATAAVIFPVLVIQDALALLLGYATGALARLDAAGRRAFTFETGIRNVGLGLVILLEHFRGLGGALLIVAGWGVWHLISGGILATAWARFDSRRERGSSAEQEAQTA